MAGFFVSSAVFVLGIGSLLAGGRHFIPLVSTCAAGGVACSCAAVLWRRAWLGWAAWAFSAGVIVFFVIGK